MALHEVIVSVRLPGGASLPATDRVVAELLRAFPEAAVQVLNHRVAMSPGELPDHLRAAIREARIPPEHAAPEHLMDE